VSRAWMLGRLAAIAICIVGAIWAGCYRSPTATTDSTRSYGARMSYRCS